MLSLSLLISQVVMQDKLDGQLIIQDAAKANVTLSIPMQYKHEDMQIWSSFIEGREIQRADTDAGHAVDVAKDKTHNR